jgi:hypothetical protein
MSDLLSDTDLQYLRAKGYDFEVVVEANMICVVLKEFDLPSGYSPENVDLLLRLPLQFPEAGPDMFWTSPDVRYLRGGSPPQTQVQEHHVGRTWQRWSRHFGQSNWRPGVDDLRSYVRLIRSTMEREVGALAA